MKQDVTTELFYDAVWNPAPIYERSQMAVKIGRPTAEGGDQPSSVEPVIDNRSAAYHPRNAGGALYGKIGRNTPVRVRVAGVSRFAGEAAGWLPGQSLDGNDSWVNLAAAGVTRRLGQGEQPLQTAPYRYATLGDLAAGYWPLDEGTLADLGTPARGEHRMTVRSAAAIVKPGEGELGPWLGKGVKISGGTAGTPYMEASVKTTPAANVLLGFVYAGGVGVWSGLFYGSDGSTIWRVRFDEAAGQISVRIRTGGESGSETTLATVSHAAASDRRCHHVGLLVVDHVAGTGVDYSVYIDGALVIGITN